MSEPITVEDIYKLFAKTNEKFEQSQREWEKSRQEYDKRFQESKREYDKRLQESKREYDKRFQESKQEADRSLAELKKAVERTTKAVDSLTTRWGRFVEELVEPAVIKLFQGKGIDVKETYSRARVKRNGMAMEIDILAVDETDVVLVECKSRLSKDDVNDFLGKLEHFKEAFPHYRHYNAYGAVAGIEIDEGVDRYAYKQGLFVIKPSGDTVAIINDDRFQAKFW